MAMAATPKGPADRVSKAFKSEEDSSVKEYRTVEERPLSTIDEIAWLWYINEMIHTVAWLLSDLVEPRILVVQYMFNGTTV